MTLPFIAGEFRIGTVPELRFTPSGMAVAECRAVASSRKEVDGQWVDDKSAWVSLVLFKVPAENFVETVQETGILVTVTGRLSIEEWEGQNGDKRITPKILVDSIGPATTFATAKVTKAQRSSGGGQGGGQWGQQQGGGPDPWTSQSSGSQGNQGPDPWASTGEPPF